MRSSADRSRVLLGSLLLGCAVLFGAAAFLVWVGTSLNKEPYDAATIAVIVVSAAVALTTGIAGLRLVRVPRRR